MIHRLWHQSRQSRSDHGWVSDRFVRIRLCFIERKIFT